MPSHSMLNMNIRSPHLWRSFDIWGATVFAILVLPVLTVIAIWLPFGFSLGGLVEEWGFLELFARKGAFYVITNATIPSQTARPLHVLPQALAYTLDPDSFLFWHIIQATTLITKAACGAVIGFYLTGNRALAAFLGLLTLLYPADTMQLSFRSLSDNCAVALALLGSVLFLIGLQVEPRWIRLGIGTASSAILACGLLMWEAVAGLAVLPPLLVFARGGKDVFHLVRERRDINLIWTLTVAAWFAYFVFAVTVGSGYQVAVLSGVSAEMTPKLLEGLVSSGMYRAFYECWSETFHIISDDLSNFWYPSCFTITVFATLVWLSERSCVNVTNANHQLALRIAVAGLISFALGYAPFLASHAHLTITQRTFLPSAIGAALVVFALFVYVSSFTNKIVVAGLSATLLGACLVTQLYQFDRYNRIYANAYRPILSRAAQFFSGTADHVSVLYNNYGYLSVVWDFGLELKPALGYLFPGVRRENIFVCEGASGRLLPRWLGEPGRYYCDRTDDSIVITKDGVAVTRLDKPVIGSLSADGVLSVESSGADRTPTSDRLVRLLSATKWIPENSMFHRSERGDQYQCRFEYMWGYAVPCRAFGFYEPQPLKAALGSSYAWIGETKAGLLFQIEPRQTAYALCIEIEKMASRSHAIHVNINGANVSGAWQDATHFEAVFPGNLLRRVKSNVLELGSDLDQNSGLSLAVKAVSITPIPEVDQP